MRDIWKRVPATHTDQDAATAKRILRLQGHSVHRYARKYTTTATKNTEICGAKTIIDDLFPSLAEVPGSHICRCILINSYDRFNDIKTKNFGGGCWRQHGVHLRVPNVLLHHGFSTNRWCNSLYYIFVSQNCYGSTSKIHCSFPDTFRELKSIQYGTDQ